MKNISKIIFVLLLSAITQYTYGQQEKISIQGTLKDASGAATSDGQYQVVFKLYQSPTGGTEVYTETAQVQTSGGIYSHYLGSVTSLDPAEFDTTLYLGVVVGGFELSPRTELTYAPYTLAANTAINTVNAQNALNAIMADTAAVSTVADTANFVLCSGAVGDIKYSILSPSQFVEENGDCWVPMNGNTHSGSALSAIIGSSTVPDMSGLFVRAHEYNNSHDPDRTPTGPIASYQADDFKSHSHSISTAVSISGSSTTGINGGDGDADTISSTGSVGGSETRPKNMNFYIYIRIN